MKKDTSYLSRVPRVPHRNLVLIVRMFLELIHRGFEKCQPKFGSIENSSFRVWDGYEFQNRFFATHTHFCPGFFCLLIFTQYKNKMGFVIRKSTKNDSKEILKLIQVIILNFLIRKVTV